MVEHMLTVLEAPKAPLPAFILLLELETLCDRYMVLSHQHNSAAAVLLLHSAQQPLVGHACTPLKSAKTQAAFLPT